MPEYPIPQLTIYLVRPLLALFSKTIVGFQVHHVYVGWLDSLQRWWSNWKNHQFEQHLIIDCFKVRLFHGATFLGAPLEEIFLSGVGMGLREGGSV